MLERQERLALTLLGTVLAIVLAGHLVLTSLGNAPLATPYGDGSREGAAIQLIDSADERRRWEAWFQIDSTEWEQVVVPWCDFLPCSPQTPFLGDQYPPSKLGAIGFGRDCGDGRPRPTR